MMLQPERYQPTLESLLVRRLEKVFEAMDIGNGFLFDEIMEETEMLLQLKPPAYNEISNYKNSLIEKANSAIEQASAIAEYASNEIQKRNFLEGEINSIEWDIRKDYLEKVVEVMGKHQMIPFEKPISAEITQTAEIQPMEEEEEVEIEQQPEPKSKPKISRSIKMRKKVSSGNDFEV